MCSPQLLSYTSVPRLTLNPPESAPPVSVCLSMHPALRVAPEPLNVAAAKLLQNEGETTTLPLLAQPWGAGNSPALSSADFRTGGQGRCH